MYGIREVCVRRRVTRQEILSTIRKLQDHFGYYEAIPKKASTKKLSLLLKKLSQMLTEDDWNPLTQEGLDKESVRIIHELKIRVPKAWLRHLPILLREDPMKPRVKKAPREKKKRPKRKPPVTVGIGEHIRECLRAGKHTREDIVKSLRKKFPDHKKRSLANTVKMYVPRMLTKQGYTIVGDPENGFKILTKENDFGIGRLSKGPQNG